MMRSYLKNIFLSCLVTGTSFASNADFQESFLLTCGQNSWKDTNSNRGDFCATIFDSPFDSDDLTPQSNLKHTRNINETSPKEGILQDSEEDSCDQALSEEYERRLAAELIERICFMKESEKSTDLSVEGISNAFFNLERAQGLFFRTPHVLTLTYALDYWDHYSYLLDQFLQSKQPEKNSENDLLLQATQIYMDLNKRALSFSKGESTVETSPRAIHGDTLKTREESIRRARAKQTRSADFIYTQGIHSQSPEEKREKLRIVTEYSKTRPLSQYFIENKTACFWVYGHLYHPVSPALPLRDNSKDWELFETIHLYQGRITEFFYKTERIIMNTTFESAQGIEDPCVSLWRESEGDAHFIESFFQTWDTAFITYLSHILVEDGKRHFTAQKMPVFLQANNIFLPTPDPMVCGEEASCSSLNEETHLSRLEEEIEQNLKEIVPHDFPVTRKKEQKTLEKNLNEYPTYDLAPSQSSGNWQQQVHPIFSAQ